MMAWVSVALQVVSLAKLVSGALGYHLADGALDSVATVLAALVAPASTVHLAKSSTFVK